MHGVGCGILNSGPGPICSCFLLTVWEGGQWTWQERHGKALGQRRFFFGCERGRQEGRAARAEGVMTRWHADSVSLSCASVSQGAAQPRWKHLPLPPLPRPASSPQWALVEPGLCNLCRVAYRLCCCPQRCCCHAAKDKTKCTWSWGCSFSPSAAPCWTPASPGFILPALPHFPLLEIIILELSLQYYLHKTITKEARVTFL